MNEKERKHYLEALRMSLKKKESLLEALLTLTKEQEVLLKEEAFDGERFERLMEEKGHHIETINRMDEGFENVYGLIKEGLEEQRFTHKEVLADMKERIATITAMGVELEAAERRNQLRLEGILAGGRSKIKQFHVGSGAAAKYYRNMMNPGEKSTYFLDRKK